MNHIRDRNSDQETSDMSAPQPATPAPAPVPCLAYALYKLGLYDSVEDAAKELDANIDKAWQELLDQRRRDCERDWAGIEGVTWGRLTLAITLRERKPRVFLMNMFKKQHGGVTKEWRRWPGKYIVFGWVGLDTEKELHAVAVAKGEIFDNTGKVYKAASELNLDPVRKQVDRELTSFFSKIICVYKVIVNEH